VVKEPIFHVQTHLACALLSLVYYLSIDYLCGRSREPSASVTYIQTPKTQILRKGGRLLILVCRYAIYLYFGFSTTVITYIYHESCFLSYQLDCILDS